MAQSYRGKQINLYISTSAGGGYDTAALGGVSAAHSGNPTIVPQNRQARPSKLAGLAPPWHPGPQPRSRDLLRRDPAAADRRRRRSTRASSSIRQRQQRGSCIARTERQPRRSGTRSAELIVSAQQRAALDARFHRDVNNVLGTGCALSPATRADYAVIERSRYRRLRRRLVERRRAASALAGERLRRSSRSCDRHPPWIGWAAARDRFHAHCR